MDALISGLFGVAVALLGIYGPAFQRRVSGSKPDPPAPPPAPDWVSDVDAELRDHDRRLRRIEPKP